MLLTNRLAANLDPWNLMRALENQVNGQLNEWFESAAQFSGSPAIRMWMQEGAATVEFDMPGVAPEDVEVSLHRNLLTVSTKDRAPEGESGAYRLRERLPTTERQLRLPFEGDPARTEAEILHGVLRVTVHQPESHRPARIEVKGK